jgi:hypothetical protein
MLKLGTSRFTPDLVRLGLLLKISFLGLCIRSGDSCCRIIRLSVAVVGLGGL